MHAKAYIVAGLLLALLLPGALYAQTNRFTAEIDRTRLYLGERAVLTITLSGPDVNSKSSWDLPDFKPAFSIVSQSGPSRQTNMQYANGKMTSQTSITTAYELQSRKEGTFTIPSMQIVLGGRPIRTNPIQMAILKVDTDEWRPPYLPYLQARVDKQEVYVGEQIVASWYVLFQRGLNHLQFQSLPVLTDFTTADMDTARRLMPVEREQGGIKYREGFLASMALFPVRSGKAVIDSLMISYSVPSETKKRGLFGDAFQEQKIVKSDPLTINVLPLPAQGRPADFTGAVGTFEVFTKLDSREVKAHDSLNLQVIVRGFGNMDYIQEPNLPFPESFEIYPPEVEEASQIKAGRLEGVKAFKYIIVPREDGVFSLPPLSFSFFDPELDKYRTISSKRQMIKVIPGRKRDEPPIARIGPASKEEVTILAEDLRYIKPDADDIPDQSGRLFESWAFMGLHGLPLALLIGAVGWKRRLEKLEQDVGYARFKRAFKVGKTHLDRAAKKINKDDPAAFYSELQQGLSHYFADRFNLAQAGLTREIIEKTARECDIQEDYISPFLECLDGCDMARFGAGTGDRAAMERTLEQARHAIQQLERSR